MTSGEKSGTQEKATIKNVTSNLNAERFRTWRQEREIAENIRNGKPFFNNPHPVKGPSYHSPSQLLLCHRKVVYQQCNAPEETSDPNGIFWIGTRFEEDIVLPFLDRAVTGPDTYVRKTVWIDYQIETEVGKLQIKGATDPLIVDADAVPLVPTEIKTKSSVKYISSPDRTHRAQLHAYMVGLSEKFDIELTEGVILYGGRESLDVKIFHVEFDEVFWEDVVIEWSTNHTRYRLEDELPPAEPEYDWECEFCSYRERCGKGSLPYGDGGITGFVPCYSDYPREKVVEYLNADPEASLTPTLARKYPDLAEDYEVLNWYCEKCDSEIDWKTVGTAADPLCPRCADEGEIASLTSPEWQPGQIGHKREHE